jgi:hypothetical protein
MCGGQNENGSTLKKNNVLLQYVNTQDWVSELLKAEV